MQLEIKGLEVSYGEQVLLGPVDLLLSRGAVVGLIGVSGSGKSLLAKSIIGINRLRNLKESYVDFYWNSESIVDDPEALKALRGRSVFYLYQDSYLSLSPSKKIRIVIEDFCNKHSLDYNEEHVIRLFSDLHINEPRAILNRYPFQVSGGQLQRLMVGIALLSNADLIIADEPTTALDAPLKIEILNLLSKKIRTANKTLLIISHNLELIQRYVDYLYILKEGKLVYNGYPENLRAEGLPYINLLLDRSEFLQNLSVTSGKSNFEETILKVDKLSVSFSQKQFLRKRLITPAVRNISFDLGEGEILGLVGRSGSGKSSIAKALAGLIAFDAASVFIKEKAIESGKINNQIKLVFQNPIASLNPELSIREQLSEALLLGGVLVDEVDAELEELLSGVGLELEVLDAYPRQISGGQGQRAAIARALATKPRILICDECLSSLDVVLKFEFISIFQSLVKKEGISIVFISHDLGAVAQLCDRVAYLEHGEILEMSESNRFFKHPVSEGLKSFIRAYDK